MPAQLRKALAALLCVAAAALLLCRTRPKRAAITPAMGHQARVCDACGHRFAGPPEPVVTECPRCGERTGVLARRYVCQACGQAFEAYRLRVADPDQPYDPETAPDLVYKRPGGRWVDSVEALGPILCPHCGRSEVRPAWPK